MSAIPRFSVNRFRRIVFFQQGKSIFFQCLSTLEDGRLTSDAKPVDADIKATQQVREVVNSELIQVRRLWLSVCYLDMIAVCYLILALYMFPV